MARKLSIRRTWLWQANPVMIQHPSGCYVRANASITWVPSFAPPVAAPQFRGGSLGQDVLSWLPSLSLSSPSCHCHYCLPLGPIHTTAQKERAGHMKVLVLLVDITAWLSPTKALETAANRQKQQGGGGSGCQAMGLIRCPAIYIYVASERFQDSIMKTLPSIWLGYKFINQKKSPFLSQHVSFSH